MAYLETQCYISTWSESGKSDLQAAIIFNGQPIPKYSLERALKELTEEGKLFIKVKAGRDEGLVVTTCGALINAAIKSKICVQTGPSDVAGMLVKLFEQLDKYSQRVDNYKQLNMWNTG